MRLLWLQIVGLTIWLFLCEIRYLQKNIYIHIAVYIYIYIVIYCKLEDFQISKGVLLQKQVKYRGTQLSLYLARFPDFPMKQQWNVCLDQNRCKECQMQRQLLIFHPAEQRNSSIQLNILFSGKYCALHTPHRVDGGTTIGNHYH